MNIGELIAFLESIKKEFGDIEVKLHIHDCTDPYAPIERFIDIDNITANKSLTFKNANNLKQYVEIYGEVGGNHKK